MRRCALIAVGLLALAAAPARAADAQVRVSNNAFSPATVNVAPGEMVTWTFAGPDTDHSTTSDPGQAESWDSDPATSTPFHVAGDTFSHRFTMAGTFTYFCKAHSFMRARVVVSAPGSPPPADTAAPQFGTAKVSVKRRRVTFRLNEAATVVFRLTGPTRRTKTITADAGTNVVKLPKRMKRGRYVVRLRATDSAGNESAVVRRAFRVR
jgi:plastocyanin